MSNTLKLKIRTGGRTFSFDIQNIDRRERTNHVQIRLPDDVDDYDDDTDDTDDTGDTDDTNVNEVDDTDDTNVNELDEIDDGGSDDGGSDEEHTNVGNNELTPAMEINTAAEQGFNQFVGRILMQQISEAISGTAPSANNSRVQSIPTFDPLIPTTPLDIVPVNNTAPRRRRNRPLQRSRVALGGQFNNLNVTVIENPANINRVVFSTTTSAATEQDTIEQAAIEHINETYPELVVNEDNPEENALNNVLDDEENALNNVLDDEENALNNVLDDEEDAPTEEDFINAIQQAIVQSMTGVPIAEQQFSNAWNITTGDPTSPVPIMIRAGDPQRPPIAFDTLVSGHPMIAMLQATHADSISFYKEIITGFDSWIRNTMQSNNVEMSQFAKTLDKMFALHLLKFPRILNNDIFIKLIQYMEESVPGETQIMSENRGKLKTIISAIREGVLDDIIKVFDTPNCSCIRCSN